MITYSMASIYSDRHIKMEEEICFAVDPMAERVNEAGKEIIGPRGRETGLTSSWLPARLAW